MKFHIYYLVVLFLALRVTAMDLPDATQVLPILVESMTVSDWKSFAQKGCGYYPIPEQLKPYLPKTLQTAQSLNSSYQGRPGYSCEEKQQVEILYFEKKDWGSYPEETAQLAEGMSKIGQSIVVNVLNALEVDQHLYAKITGGLSEGKGLSYFKLAHYDAAKDCPGLPWHKDIRFVTVLFINQEGLQGQVDGEVVQVKPLDGYFVVNLGVFFEAFINDPNKLKAFVHQVQQVQKDRISFGAFCGGDFAEKGFYQLNGPEIIWKSDKEMKAFLIEDKDQSFSMSAHTIFSGYVGDT